MSHTAHHVHGLEADSMPADWPPLRPDEVCELLAGYPHTGRLARIAWHSPRPLSAAALVDTSEGRYFIKRHHHGVRTPATLGEEHLFIAHLRAAGADVPAVMRDEKDRTAVQRGNWVFEVHACANGIDLYRDLVSWSPLLDLAHARNAGAALARLHDAAAGYDAPQRGTHILVTRDDLLRADDPLEALQAQLPQRPGLADYLRNKNWQIQLHEVIVPLQQRVRSRLTQQPRLWTHNDWHASNLCWSDAGAQATVSAVFDFGLASPTCALFDLATAIERNAIAWLELERGDGAVHIDTACALIDGYRDVRPLDATDTQLLADLLPVVHLDFALSEVEYFNAVTGSRANADVAWNTFLLGHAQWFGSAPARTLLCAIRDCA